MLKAVLFDLGDTLVNIHQETMEQRHRTLLQRHGYRRCFGCATMNGGI